MLELVILTALFTAFVLVLLTKFKVVESLQMSKYKLISQLGSCTFCLGFWLSLIICPGIAIVTANAYMLGLPIFVAPIVKVIL